MAKHFTLPAEPQPSDVTIRYAGNEQHPWSLTRFGLRMEKAALQTGDYQPKHVEGNQIVVERKELNDFLNCCTHDRPRFEREIDACLRSGLASSLSKHHGTRLKPVSGDPGYCRSR